MFETLKRYSIWLFALTVASLAYYLAYPLAREILRRNARLEAQAK